MAINKFFQNKGPYPLKKIINEISSESSMTSEKEIFDIQDLVRATENDIT